jgi:hypothetical protein
MGFVEIIDGSGYLARLEDDQVTIEPTDDKCMACNDDRLIHDGNYLVCTQCHCRQ